MFGSFFLWVTLSFGGSLQRLSSSWLLRLLRLLRVFGKDMCALLREVCVCAATICHPLCQFTLQVSMRDVWAAAVWGEGKFPVLSRTWVLILFFFFKSISGAGACSERYFLPCPGLPRSPHSVFHLIQPLTHEHTQSVFLFIFIFSLLPPFPPTLFFF